MTAIPVDEIVGFLNREAPEVLRQLKTSYPEDAELLEPGIIAGEADDAERARQIAVRSAIAVAGLREAVSLCNRVLPRVRRRLETSARIQLVGQIASCIGGASVLATVALAYPDVTTYIAAILALVGSLAAILAQHARTGVGGGNLVEQYKALVEARAEATSIRTQIEIIPQADVSQLVSLITSANVMCQKIATAEAFV